MNGDDKLAHPYTVSSAAWSAITAAVSHLSTLHNSFIRSGDPAEIHALVHTHGQLTLVRGALENSSLAWWLLQDDDSTERIARRLQEDWQERRQLENMRAEIGSPSTKTFTEYETELTDILSAAGGDPSTLKSRPGYGEIVKLVGAEQPTGATAAFVTWKACSSIAHGELRGLIAYQKTSVVGSTLTGDQLNEITGNVELLCTGGLIAVATTRAALRLYRQRSGSNMTI